MRFTPAEIPEVILIEPDVHRDARGYFLESYHAPRYAAAGIVGPFVQDNHSLSVEGTIRGLHLQRRHAQAKLVRVIEGAIYDVVVDVRRGSPTFGKWVAVTLSADNFLQCFVPPGFAHGFCVTTPVAAIEYKCTDLYDPGSEIGIAWDDPALAIPWPVSAPILSARDRCHPRLADVATLPAFAPRSTGTGSDSTES